MPRGDLVFLRPFGYVESEPVISRVDDRGVFVGNVRAADGNAHDRSFAHVLTLTEETQPLTTHHHGFPDGPEHDYRAFAAAVDVARTLLGKPGETLVHCRAGVSRSATVLATALAATDDRPFRDSLRVVERARPAAVPHPALVESAVVYLAADHDDGDHDDGDRDATSSTALENPTLGDERSRE